MTGHLFLLVGPSGSGKDSLLDGAREHFKNSKAVYFPKRYITRAADAGGEDHIAVDIPEFINLQNNGKMALSWDAHDLKYGVPVDINTYLENDTNVVVNVSRGIIDETLQAYEKVTVLSITVNEQELKRRLTERGRESQAEIEKRLSRALAFNVSGPHVVDIDNSGLLDQSIEAFIKAIS